MTESEYIDECILQCRICKQVSFSRSCISGRSTIWCLLKGHDQYDYMGLEEFFLNSENWRDCEHFVDRMMRLFDLKRERVPFAERTIKIK